MISTIDPVEKRNDGERLSKGNFLKSFKTISLIDRNQGNKEENTGMEKFFKKIKNNLEYSLSHKNEKNNKFKITSNIKDIKEIKEISSSDDEENNENNENSQNGNNNNFFKSSKKIIDENPNNEFAQNFIKQSTVFGNNFLKFNGGKNSNTKYESSVLDSPIKRKIINKFNCKGNDDIEEGDEDQNEFGNSYHRNSQDLSFFSYSRIRNIFLNHAKDNIKETIKIGEYKTQKNNNILKKRNINSSKDLISQDSSIYNKSDYEDTLRLGSIIESNNCLENTNDNTNDNNNENNNMKINNKNKLNLPQRKGKE